MDPDLNSGSALKLGSCMSRSGRRIIDTMVSAIGVGGFVVSSNMGGSRRSDSLRRWP
jgi:hypothetical protein